MTTMNNGKALITQNSGGLSISIPSHKTWLILIFGTFWIAGWVFGLVTVLNFFTSGVGSGEGHDVFTALWLVGWTLGGLSVIGLLFWGYFGKEEFHIPKGKREVLFKKHIFGLGLKRRLEKSQIQNFRFYKVSTDLLSMQRSWAVWGVGTGKIKFDYGMKTYSMGLGLDDAEANYIIYLLDDSLG